MRICVGCALVTVNIVASLGQAVAQPYYYPPQPRAYYGQPPSAYYYYYGPAPGGYYPSYGPAYPQGGNSKPGGDIRHQQDPTTRRLIAPLEDGSLDYHLRISRKAIKRPNCRPSSAASSSPTPRPSPLAPSSSTHRTRFYIWCSATVKRCATALALVAQGSPGRALSASAG